MEIEVYYLEKEKLYVPLFDVEISKSGILSCFVKGKGWIKVKKYEKLKIEIPDTKDNMIDIKETALKYGDTIVKEYLMTNNAEFWKSYVLFLSKNTNLDRVGYNKFVETFGPLYRYFNGKLSCFGYVFFDVVEFDSVLHKDFGYTEEKDGSIENFLQNNYPEIYDFIKYLIDKY